MAIIQVICGAPYKPERLLHQMARNKKLAHIRCKPVQVLYSPCWIFSFSVDFSLTKKRVRHLGCYGGVDEQSTMPGLVSRIPDYEEMCINDMQLLPDKLKEEQAKDLAWSYNKRWIARKNRMSHCVPVLTSTKTLKLYKPLYLLEFYNQKLDQTLYKVYDSLTGDLDNLVIQS